MSDTYSPKPQSETEYASLVQLLRHRAEHHPDRVAYTFLADGETETASLTYGILDRQARAIAALLQSCCVPGEHALLLYPSGLEFIAAFFGCLYAQVLAVPVYPPRQHHRLSRLEAIAANAQATVVLTTASLLADRQSSNSEQSLLTSLKWRSTDEIDLHWALEWREPHVNTSTLAFLQYTSGSTGVPKGVMVSHGNLLDNSALIHRCFEHTPNSRALVWLPLYHDMGLIGGVIQPLYGGFPSMLIPPEVFIKKPSCWLQSISRYRVTSSGGPNLGFELCSIRITPEQRANLDLSCWDVAFTGAEPIRKHTLERFSEIFKPCGFRQESFYPCYGMAEATLLISGGLKAHPPIIYPARGDALEENRVVFAQEELPGIKHIVGCGRSWLDRTTIVVNPDSLIPCSPSQVGEIWISSPSVAQGYWNQPSETEKIFCAYLADTGEGPFLRTGDLGFIHAGELFVTGRLKDLIIILGRNYYPQDIELTVEQSHPALRPGGGAAFSVEVENREKLVVVQEVERTYLRKLNGSEAIAAIRHAITEGHGLPIHAVLLLKTASLPKTSSGKVKRSACKTMFLNLNLDVVSEWKAMTRAITLGEDERSKMQ
jgi:acyl-CoA synthetase (AMP-forming)/AMP-acid ligase II